ncbi:hypothetical protein BV25DRAFT_18587 [Artomyces pyxidatus]|uniref:Uncharacterized protein n=1 Tax=Artomyces pyxidatus TaxID=48021 RepID=A0ACB8TJN1_9AGAM|nr:hypothetical protein BV25DRAFT_18587 [Artomyces pyxidatus]
MALTASTKPGQLAPKSLTVPIQSSSRYLQPTASTSQKAAVSAPAKNTKPLKSSSLSSSTSHLKSSRTHPPAAKERITHTHTNERDPKRSLAKSAAPAERVIVKASAARQPQTFRQISQRTVPAVPPSRAVPPPKPPIPSRERPDDAALKDMPDSVQVASQVYAWCYMQSGLTLAFSTAETNAKESINTLQGTMPQGGDGFTDDKDRHDIERLAHLFGTLSAAETGSRLPTIVRSFMSHDNEWSKLEDEVMHFVTQISDPSSSPLDDSGYGQLLKRLESEASTVTTMIGELEEVKRSVEQQLGQTLSKLLSVLQVHAQNISLSQELILCVREI